MLAFFLLKNSQWQALTKLKIHNGRLKIYNGELLIILKIYI